MGHRGRGTKFHKPSRGGLRGFNEDRCIDNYDDDDVIKRNAQIESSSDEDSGSEDSGSDYSSSDDDSDDSNDYDSDEDRKRMMRRKKTVILTMIAMRTVKKKVRTKAKKTVTMNLTINETKLPRHP